MLLRRASLLLLLLLPAADLDPPLLLQRDVAGGTDYCRRKVLLVKDRLEQLSGLVKERQAALMQVNAMLEQRLGEQAAAGGQQAAAGPAAGQQKK